MSWQERLQHPIPGHKAQSQGRGHPWSLRFPLRDGKQQSCALAPRPVLEAWPLAFSHSPTCGEEQAACTEKGPLIVEPQAEVGGTLYLGKAGVSISFLGDPDRTQASGSASL